MARERYVRPPLVAREAPPAWRVVWPFRLGVLLLLAALTALLVWGYSVLNDASDQDPGLRASGAARGLGVVVVVGQRHVEDDLRPA